MHEPSPEGCCINTDQTHNWANPASRQHQQLDQHPANVFIPINHLQRTRSLTKATPGKTVKVLPLKMYPENRSPCIQLLSLLICLEKK